MRRPASLSTRLAREKFYDIQRERDRLCDQLASLRSENASLTARLVAAAGGDHSPCPPPKSNENLVCAWIEDFAQFIGSSQQRAGAAVDAEIKALRTIEKMIRARHGCHNSSVANPPAISGEEVVEALAHVGAKRAVWTTSVASIHRLTIKDGAASALGVEPAK